MSVIMLSHYAYYNYAECCYDLLLC